MNGHRHSNTDPYGRTGVGLPPKDEGQKGVVFDLEEVRRRLKQKSEPTTKDLAEALEVERAFSDSLDIGLGQVRRDLIAMDAHFSGNVREVVAEDLAAVKPLSSRVTWGIAIGILAFILGLLGNIVGWSALTSASSAKDQVTQVKRELADKADRAEVTKLSAVLLTKADKSELKAIEAKADKSVVERLAAELENKGGAHDQRLNDLATDLMSKADKTAVAKIAARLRSTRAQVNVLQKRVQDLQDAAQPPPAAQPPAVDHPKTM